MCFLGAYLRAGEIVNEVFPRSIHLFYVDRYILNIFDVFLYKTIHPLAASTLYIFRGQSWDLVLRVICHDLSVLSKIVMGFRSLAIKQIYPQCKNHATFLQISLYYIRTCCVSINKLHNI